MADAAAVRAQPGVAAVTTSRQAVIGKASAKVSSIGTSWMVSKGFFLPVSLWPGYDTGIPGDDKVTHMTLKRLLVLFWAAYFSLTFLTNVTDAAKALEMVPTTWPFASGNYDAITQTTARYGAPAKVNAVLFGGVIVWEGLAAFQFWVAWVMFPRRHLVRAAFSVGLLLWAALLIADEVCIAYAVEATHWRLFTALLATLVAIELIPEDDEPDAPPEESEILVADKEVSPPAPEEAAASGGLQSPG